MVHRPWSIVDFSMVDGQWSMVLAAEKCLA
jgi:hypothetical protein